MKVVGNEGVPRLIVEWCYEGTVVTLAWREGLYRAVEVRPQVGRNDPCPCGSGKKYKQCCLGGEGGRVAKDT